MGCSVFEAYLFKNAIDILDDGFKVLIGKRMVAAAAFTGAAQASLILPMARFVGHVAPVCLPRLAIVRSPLKPASVSPVLL